MDQQLFSFILVKRRLSSYFCQVNSPISFLKQKTVSGAPASFCLDCVNVGKALEDAKAAQELVEQIDAELENGDATSSIEYSLQTSDAFADLM